MQTSQCLFLNPALYNPNLNFLEEVLAFTCRLTPEIEIGLLFMSHLNREISQAMHSTLKLIRLMTFQRGAAGAPRGHKWLDRVFLKRDY